MMGWMALGDFSLSYFLFIDKFKREQNQIFKDIFSKNIILVTLLSLFQSGGQKNDNKLTPAELSQWGKTLFHLS